MLTVPLISSLFAPRAEDIDAATDSSSPIAVFDRRIRRLEQALTYAERDSRRRAADVQSARNQYEQARKDALSDNADPTQIREACIRLSEAHLFLTRARARSEAAHERASTIRMRLHEAKRSAEARPTHAPRIEKREPQKVA
jgi:hypothetical protein